MAKKTTKLSRGRRLTKATKIKKATAVCELYATDQYTLQTCLNDQGIKSDSTWYKWIEEVEEIAELYLKAIEEKERVHDQNLVERAITVFEQALHGQKITLIERTGTVTQTDDGQELITTKGVKERQIYIQPSLKAAEFILVNLHGRKFSRNPQPYQAGNVKYPDKINIEIVNGSIAPVTSEDDIIEPEI